MAGFLVAVGGLNAATVHLFSPTLFDSHVDQAFVAVRIGLPILGQPAEPRFRMRVP